MTFFPFHFPDFYFDLLFHFLIEKKTDPSLVLPPMERCLSFLYLLPWMPRGTPFGNWPLGFPTLSEKLKARNSQNSEVLVSGVTPSAPTSPVPCPALACISCSSGASGLMNYESSLGVPTGAYGSAETPGLET